MARKRSPAADEAVHLCAGSCRVCAACALCAHPWQGVARHPSGTETGSGVRIRTETSAVSLEQVTQVSESVRSPSLATIMHALERC